MSSTRDPNKHDTPAIDMSVNAKCNKTVIATGFKDNVTNENVKAQIHDFIAVEDHSHTHDIRFKSKSVALIICKDWAGYSYFMANKYNKKDFLGKPVFLTMFRDTDPNN